MDALVVLDCDGVIFPFAPEYVDDPVWPDLVETVVTDDGRTMVLSPTLIASLNRLMRLGVRFVFASAWFGETSDFPKTLGFPPIDYELDEIRLPGWWKLQYISSLPKTTEILWVDDDIKDDREALAWLETVRDRVTYVSPSIYHGISPTELATIEAWVNARK